MEDGRSLLVVDVTPMGSIMVVLGDGDVRVTVCIVIPVKRVIEEIIKAVELSEKIVHATFHGPNAAIRKAVLGSQGIGIFHREVGAMMFFIGVEFDFRGRYCL